MLTRNGHRLAAYVLMALGMCHWLAGHPHRLAAMPTAEQLVDEQLGAEPAAATTEPAD